MARKALVVEDEGDLAQILAELLRGWGFEPTVLANGKPAPGWVRMHRPDVVLLDVMLEDTNGFSVCESLKLDRDTNMVPVIMVTILSGHEDKVQGLTVGANRYLTKPFSAEELHRAIDDVLAWRDELSRHGKEGEIRFQLQSDTKYLEELNDLLSSLLLHSGLSETQARQLTTAVRELGANAIEWGHQKQVERIVTVDYQIDPEKITIIIRDTGPGFNPTNLPHAADSEDPIRHIMVRETLGLREGGFGIMMSRGLVDDMKYNEAGNEVRLVKFFPPRSRQPSNGH